ncbi:hypothetical protein TWF106_000116 [Orbilia oligospora]|uniref:Insecticide toxin TcdB middle/N-terminal domain-containing protein n=1 Tax=Orbilia oligospora TaxID=2813651 RepID=A0A7C8V1H6_ORBOL|nr:hypothetical protein TWF106_000116 [Orbilia oligospora]
MVNSNDDRQSAHGQGGSHKPSEFTQPQSDNTPQRNSPGSKTWEPLYQGQKIPELGVSFNTSGKGGGGLRAIGETFKVNSSNGTLDLSIPIHTSPGRSGFGPSLSLSYSSGSGNGPFGIGWSLSAGEISRKTSHRIPVYDDSDTFLMNGGEDLVPLEGPDGRLDTYTAGGFLVQSFRPLIETVPTLIEQWTNLTDTGDVHWRTVSEDNITTIYGLTDESRIFVSKGSKRQVYSWLECQTYDGWGNAMEFKYKGENSTGVDLLLPHEQERGDDIRQRARYLKTINYGNRKPARAVDNDGKWAILPFETMEWLFRVVLDYGEHDETKPTTQEVAEWSVRRDSFSRYKSGFEIREYRLCKRILMFHHIKERLQVEDCLISSTSLTYNEDPAASLISSVTYQAYKIHSDESNTQHTIQTLPPLEFSYSKVTALENVSVKSITTGLADRVDVSQAVNSVQWIDLDGDGTPGMLLCYENGGWFYQRNLVPIDEEKNVSNGALGPTRLLKCQPNLRVTSFNDLDGSGYLDAVCIDEQTGIAGYFQRTEDDGWSDFKPFHSWPNINSSDPQLRVDLTGDGRPDILKTEDNPHAFLWYPSLAKSGYDVGRHAWNLHQLPQLVSSDPRIGIYLADMSGSGSEDIVHVQNGCVSYWPNLGYGRFGAEIKMSNSPNFDYEVDFSSNRVYFLDIDGSGTSDMIHIDPTGAATVYYNYCGNEWSKGEMVFTLDPEATPLTLDILGNGTAALCWTNFRSAYPNKIYYIDFMGGRKPHLLTNYKNGMGCETSVKYKPSSYYFLADELEKQPWTTKLPFPVQCVSEVSMEDKIAMSLFVSRYRYHDGYFDAKEREFRGFGMVEEISEDTFFTNSTTPFKPPPKNKKVWYHTGSIALSQNLKYGEGRLRPSKIPKGLPYDDEYYALRALKGMELRQEAYGQDGSTKSASPYNETETRYNVRMLQASRDRSQKSVSTQSAIWGDRDRFPAAFRVEPLESIACHHERAYEDTRILHEMTLDVDLFGNPTATLSIAYGRQRSDLSDEVDKEAQEEDTVELHEDKYASATNDKAGLRASAHVSSRTSRIFGLSREKGQLLDIEKVAKDQNSIIRLAKEESLSGHKNNKGVTAAEVSKVLIAESRLYFKNGDMTAQLPLGSMDLFSVVDQSYILSIDDGLIKQAYGPQETVSDYSLSVLLETGGFKHLDDDKTSWWIPSGKFMFSENDDTKSQLECARTNFYIPAIAVSALGYREKVDLDPFHLLPIQKSDNLGNLATASYDYARLQVTEHTDQNMNRQSFSIDAFGSVVGIARQGKVSEQIGDSLEGFNAILPNDEILAFIKDPTTDMAATLLGKSSWRIIQCPNGYYASSKDSGLSTTPSFEALVSRSYHYADKQMEDRDGISIVITYFDGSGHEIEKASLVTEKNETTTRTWRKYARTARNRAGTPIRIYHPSLSPSHMFDFKIPDTALSFTYVLDGLDRVAAVMNPDKTWTKTVFAAWATSEYCAASTIKISDPRSDQDVGPIIQTLDEQCYLPTWSQTQEASTEKWKQNAASKSAAYGTLPTISYYDPDGREILHTRQTKDGSLLKTRFRYDTIGLRSEVEDCMGRLIETRLHDYQGHLLKHGLMDKGYDWTLYNIAGLPILTWNGTGVYTKHSYDVLGRLVSKEVKKSGALAILAVKIAYGDELEPSQTDPGSKNLRGQIVSVRDQSGLSRNLAFDFKGNCLRESRALAVEYRTDIDWNKTPDLDMALETVAEFDALDRLAVVTNSIGNSTKRRFNKQGNLEFVAWRQSVDKQWRTMVSNIEYAGDGQVLKIDYGNGAHTENTYDEASRMLIHRKLWRERGTILEDVSYFYDCIGKKTYEIDAAQETAYFNNNVVKAEKDFTYDELGRLIQAKGREQVYTGDGSQKGFRAPTSGFPGSKNQIPSSNCELAMYQEAYEYDETDNLLSLKHQSAENSSISGWTRVYTYQEDNILDQGKTKGNRLSETSYPGKTERFTYDDHETDERIESFSAIDTEVQSQDKPQKYDYQDYAGGIGCITSFPGYPSLGWDHESQLRSSVRQIYRDGTPQTTWYTYDYRGVRTRKVTDRAAQKGEPLRKLQETIYNGSHIIHQVFNGNGRDVRTRTDSSEVGGTLGHFAVIEQLSSSDPLIRYQANNSLELDDSGAIVSYQEYSPFGAPTYAARRSEIEAPRRYRFAAYERDNETGLYHCGARYYAVWLGRWISPDPVGLEDGPNLYVYVGNDPVNYQDPEGTMKGGGKGAKSPRGNRATENENKTGYTTEHESGGPEKQGIKIKKKKKNKTNNAIKFYEKINWLRGLYGEQVSDGERQKLRDRKRNGGRCRIPDSSSKAYGALSTELYQKHQLDASRLMNDVKNKYQLEGVSFEQAKIVTKGSAVGEDKILLQPKFERKKGQENLKQQIGGSFGNLANNITNIITKLNDVVSGREKVELAMLRDKEVTGYDSRHAEAATSIRNKVIPAWSSLLERVQTPRR